MIRKTNAAEEKLLAGIGAALQTDLHVRRALGFPHAASEEAEKEVVLGRGLDRRRYPLPGELRQVGLAIDTGVDPDADEIAVGSEQPKAFPWSLSIGCAPHPFAILYGILSPKGSSVTAQTTQGAVALNAVAIEPRLHANGALVDGVFSALPSELTVLSANGSTVYTESLQAQAAEAAQFCEGYEEP